jgi:sulfur-oxidizing protein SoxX
MQTGARHASRSGFPRSVERQGKIVGRHPGDLDKRKIGSHRQFFHGLDVAQPGSVGVKDVLRFSPLALSIGRIRRYSTIPGAAGRRGHPDPQPIAFILGAVILRANHRGNRALTEIFSPMSGLLRALVLALMIGAAMPATTAGAQSGAADGQRLAFDRGKGNCLSCHEIRGGDLPGTIGPPLKDIKSKYPDRNDLIAILTDETIRNPQTAMPPFGRNHILTEQEIRAIVDFLQTL